MKSNANTRTSWVHLKATPDERSRWQAMAAAAGVTLADLLRARLASAPVGRPRGKVIAADPALLAGIAKVGNNLNQVGRWANSYKGAADAVQVLAALSAIERQLSFFVRTNGLDNHAGD